MKKATIIKSFLPGILILFIVFGIISFPGEAVNSARVGMNIWLNTLVPSLLPFLIFANILISLKLIDLFGLFLEPITRFLFNVPGKGSLVFAMSITSGYPIGSKLTAQLREKKEVTKYEAQRLASFCSTSGPLFLMGAVGIGMFKNPHIGYFIALTHYLSALTVGIIFRNYGKKLENNYNLNKKTNIIDEIKNIIILKNKENKNFYTILGDAVKDGINTILMVGGFVIIFAVIFKILKVVKFIDIITNFLFILLNNFNISKEIIYSSISGLFEITIGCNNVSLCQDTSLILKISLCSFIISFSGISILAQSCNFLNKTDINISIYIISKFIHAVIAFIYSYLLYPIFQKNIDITAFHNNISYLNYINGIFPKILYYNNIILMSCIIIYIMSYINPKSLKNKGID